MSGTVDRAIVIGSSMAGLLAARVLSETYAEVILLDRDDLPYGPVDDHRARPVDSESAGILPRRDFPDLCGAGADLLRELGVDERLVDGSRCLHPGHDTADGSQRGGERPTLRIGDQVHVRHLGHDDVPRQRAEGDLLAPA